MLYYLTQFNIEVDRNLQGIDASEVSSDDRDEKIHEALSDFSRHRPMELIAAVPGDDGQFYPISDATSGSAWAGTSGSLYTHWEEGSSSIIEIEYPAADISADEDPEYLWRYGWDDNYRDDSGNRWLWFINDSPGTTETFKARYTAPYSFSGSPSAVSLSSLSFRAVCNKAASLCCDLLAARYGQTTRSTYDIESINYLTKAEEYRRMSGEFQTTYEELMGIPRLKRTRASASVKKLPVTSSLHGARGTLFHDY